MKIALITANIGGIDEVYPPAKQTEDYDFICYTENTLPFPLPNLNNRLKGKYFKTQAHRFLDHDIFIWIDGSVSVIKEEFIEWIKEQLNDCDIVAGKHFDRDNVFDEIKFIQKYIREGNPYLISRYINEPFQQEYDYYVKEGLPKDYPLYNCWFFARKNNPKMNKMFDQWWDMILRFTNFDQTQFSYVAWENKVTIKDVDTAEYLLRTKHK